MSEVPSSPLATRLGTPSWLDGRLVLGVLLVLGSVLVGARVLSAADRSQQVWVTTQDLAPGTVLVDADLRQAKVRLFTSSGLYAGAIGRKPVGYVVRRGLGTAELLPLGALARPDQDLAYRDVTVPVAVGHLPPDLAHGDQVDVYVTPGQKSGRAPAAQSGTDLLMPHLVLRGVAIQRVERGGGLAAGGQDQPVLLTVRPSDVLAVVQAMALGQLDLVEVPRRQQLASLTAAGSTPGSAGPANATR